LGDTVFGGCGQKYQLRRRHFFENSGAESEEVMWQRLDTKTILIALVIINVIAIGLSEIQRRTLIESAIRAQAAFQAPANRAAGQQAAELERMVKQLSELTARVNHTEILTLSAPDAYIKIQDISARVMEIQKRLDGLERPRN
jgi:hypothetical protein